MKKKIFAGLLALCMVISMLPLTAFAAKDDVTLKAGEELKAESFAISTLSVMAKADGSKPDGLTAEAIKAKLSYSGKLTYETEGDNSEKTEAAQSPALGELTAVAFYTDEACTANEVTGNNFKPAGEAESITLYVKGTISANATSKTVFGHPAYTGKIGSVTITKYVDPDAGKEKLDITKGEVVGLTGGKLADMTYTGSAQTPTTSGLKFKQTFTRPNKTDETKTVSVEKELAFTSVKFVAVTPSREGEAPDLTKVTDAGTYNILATIDAGSVEAGDDYAAFDYTALPETQIGTLTVKPATNTITFEYDMPTASNGKILMTDNKETSYVSFAGSAAEAATAAGVTYTVDSSDHTVFTVTESDGDITITPVGVGKATITVKGSTNANVTTADKTSVAIEIVKGDAQTFTASAGTDEGTPIKLAVGETKAITIGTGDTDYPAAGRTYESSDTKVATVDKDGKVTGVGDGKATITVTGTSTKFADATEEVFVEVVADLAEVTMKLADSAATDPEADFTGGTKTVVFDKDNLTVNTITATAKFEKGTDHTQGDATVTWTSSDTTVATVVEGTGVVTIVKPGTVTITASVASVTAGEGVDHGAATASYTLKITENKPAKVVVTVTTPADSIVYNGKTWTLAEAGDTNNQLAITVQVGPDADTLSALTDTYYDAEFSNNVNAGENATVKVTLKDGYSGTGNATFKIKPGTTQSITLTTVVNPKNPTIDLSNAVNMPADGKIDSSVNWTVSGDTAKYITGIKGSGTTLTLTLDSLVAMPNSDTTITITGTEAITSDNYAASTCTITLKFTDKKLATIDKDTVNLQVAAPFEGGDGCQHVSAEATAWDSASHTDAEKAAHAKVKCYANGYRKATIAEANKSAIICITSDVSSLAASAISTTLADVSVTALTTDADLEAAGTTAAKAAEAHKYYFKIAVGNSSVKGTETVTISVSAGESEYAATTLYLTINVNEVALVAPIKDDVTDPSTGDEPGTDDPTPVEDVNVGTDEKGQITEDKKADTNLIITNEDAGIVAGVPAGIEGKVEATVAPVDVTVTTVDEDGNEVEQTVEATKVEIKVDGEIPEIDIPTAITVKEEDLAAIENKDMVVAYVLNEDGTMTALPKSSLNEDGLLTAHVPNGSTVIFKEAESNLTGLDETYEAAANAMNYLSARGIMNGKDNNAAEPKATTNRYELVMMLHNLERNAEKGTVGDFGDVKEGHWASNAVTWAFEMGIAKGDGTNFNGENEMTRQELAVFLYRYAQQYAKGTLSVKFEGEIVDNDKLADWAEEAMRWAVGNGIINGDGNGSVMPQATATREQVAMMLTRLLKAI